VRWLIVLFLVFLVPGCARPPAIASVDRFDASIVLEFDGSATVFERITVRPAGSAHAVLERRIAADRTDGILDVLASMDGPDGAVPGGTGQVTVDAGRDPAGRWRLPPAAGGPYVLELRYRATGVVEIQGMRGTFSWPVLPTDRQYDIGTATVSLRLPAGTRLLQPPQFDTAGWQWTTTGEALVASKITVARTEPAVLTAILALDAVPMLEPYWQTRAALGQQLVPSFIAAALFILVTAAGILWAIRLQYFQPRETGTSAKQSRIELARGLRTAGIVVIVLGLASAALAYVLLRSLGDWPQAVPVSLVLSGLWFVAAGQWYGSRARTGGSPGL
jgi:hypothetical protein